jgi:hypothetical protein
MQPSIKVYVLSGVNGEDIAIALAHPALPPYVQPLFSVLPLQSAVAADVSLCARVCACTLKRHVLSLHSPLSPIYMPTPSPHPLASN